MNNPTVTINGQTFTMQPISDETWRGMGMAFEAEEAYRDTRDDGLRYIPDPRDGINNTWGT